MYKMGLDEVADLTHQEFSAMHIALKAANLWSVLRRLATREYNGKYLAVSGRDHSRYHGAESHVWVAWH